MPFQNKLIHSQPSFVSSSQLPDSAFVFFFINEKGDCSELNIAGKRSNICCDVYSSYCSLPKCYRSHSISLL